MQEIAVNWAFVIPRNFWTISILTKLTLTCDLVGAAVLGSAEGAKVGDRVGCGEGSSVGLLVGLGVGLRVGWLVGSPDGCSDG